MGQVRHGSATYCHPAVDSVAINERARTPFWLRRKGRLCGCNQRADPKHLHQTSRQSVRLGATGDLAIELAELCFHFRGGGVGGRSHDQHHNGDKSAVPLKPTDTTKNPIIRQIDTFHSYKQFS
jgi:hypothetical protein